jgi:hypothetical protein
VEQESRCTAKTRGGQPCQAQPLPGKAFCFTHDPESSEARAAARRKGGKARCKPAAVLPGDTPEAPLKSVQDVVAFLGQTASQVRRGDLDAKAGNCLAGICGQLLKALEMDLTEELAKLRKSLEALANGDGRAAGVGEAERHPGPDAPGDGAGGPPPR